MKTALSLESTHSAPLPHGHEHEFRTPDALVEHFLEAYSEPGDAVLDVFAGYGTTLTVAERLDRVPYGVDGVLAPDGHVVVDVANMKHEGRVTTLAWDVADRISNVFSFQGEVVVTWDEDESGDEREGEYGYGYDHSYCLVFEKPAEE